jgi:hypothetical protein
MRENEFLSALNPKQHISFIRIQFQRDLLIELPVGPFWFWCGTFPNGSCYFLSLRAIPVLVTSSIFITSVMGKLVIQIPVFGGFSRSRFVLPVSLCLCVCNSLFLSFQESWFFLLCDMRFRFAVQSFQRCLFQSGASTSQSSQPSSTAYSFPGVLYPSVYADPAAFGPFSGVRYTYPYKAQPSQRFGTFFDPSAVPQPRPPAGLHPSQKADSYDPSQA